MIQNKAKCFCIWPFFGPHCINAAASPLTGGDAIGLRGDGFVEIHTKSEPKDITILFSTEAAEAILYIQGTIGNNISITGLLVNSSKDALKRQKSNFLSAENGQLLVAVVQDGSYYQMRCNIRIDDGQLHTLKVSKKPNLLSMQLDDHEKIQQIINKALSRFDKSHFVLGGHMQAFHDGKAGFKGCLYQLIIDNMETNLKKLVTEGNVNNVKTANIVPCLE